MVEEIKLREILALASRKISLDFLNIIHLKKLPHVTKIPSARLQIPQQVEAYKF
jgi:hypothetical protein